MSISYDTIAAMLHRPGFRIPAGGVIDLPEGEHAIHDTIEIGDGTAAGTQPCVTLRGVGPGGVANNGATWGGTVLRWEGPPGKPILRVNGCMYPRIERIGFRLDSSEGTHASAGIELTGDNAAGATTQLACIDGCSFSADHNTLNCSVGVHITGEQFNDQVDKTWVVNCMFNGVGTGILQTSQQSVATLIENCSFSCFFRNVAVLDGNAVIQSCAMSERHWPSEFSGTRFIAVHLGANPSAQWHTAHDCVIRDSHFEMHLGRFIVIDAAIDFPQTIEGCKIQMQNLDAESEMTILDSINAGPVAMRGCTINSASGGAGLIRQLGGPLIYDGNYTRKWVRELRFDTIEARE